MSRHRNLVARMLASAAVVVLGVSAASPSFNAQPAQAQGDSSQVMVIPVPMSAQNLRYMDIIGIDQTNHKLYTGDAWTGGVDVFDLSTPNAQYAKSFFVRGSGHGVTWAPDVQKVFVGMDDGTVAVIDTNPSSPTTGTIIDRVDTGGHGAADEMDYDPALQKLYVAHRNEGFIVSIDAVNDVLVNTIGGLHGILEQPRYNPVDGMMYEVSPSDNVIYEFDPKVDALVNTIDIGTPCSPSGLGINPQTNVAFLACGGRSNPTAVYMSLANDTVIGQSSTTGGGDSAIYDPVADRFFYDAKGTNGPNQMNIFSGGTTASPIPQLLATVPVDDISSSVGYDETNHVIYTGGMRDGIPVLLGIPLPQ